MNITPQVPALPGMTPLGLPENPTPTIRNTNTLSGLLRLAIRDARTFPVDHLCMTLWVEMGKDNQCHVCMAGAIMVRELGCKDHMEMLRKTGYSPSSYPSDIEAKLYAVNALRKGYVVDAAKWLGVVVNFDDHDPALYQAAVGAGGRDTCPWVNDWYAHLQLADALEKAGL